MKFIFPIILSLLSTAQASENYLLSCIGNRSKVSISIEKIQDKVRFTYLNTDGKKDFPLFEGVVTVNTFPILKSAQKDLSSIDSKLILEWNLEQCNKSISNPMIIECNGESKILFPLNSKLKSMRFFTSTTKEITPSFTYEVFKVRLGLDTENMHYLATMPFGPNYCHLNDDSELKSSNQI